MITLDDIKLHCRIDHDDEDSLLTQYHAAAREQVENYICRPLFDTVAPPDVEDGIAMTRSIEQAMLLLIGHWYAHRESVADVSMSEVPHGVHALLQPYRVMGV